MLLLISKNPQFSKSGEVVLGQCEPNTGDWVLRIFGQGPEGNLLTGTYLELFSIQKACANKDEAGIRSTVEKMGKALEDSRRSEEKARLRLERRQVSGSTTELSTEDVHRAAEDEDRMCDLVSQLSVQLGSPDGFHSISLNNNILVAVVGSKQLLEESEAKLQDFLSLLSFNSEGLVLDLSKVHVITASGIRLLMQAEELSTQTNNVLTLSDITTGLRKVVEMANLETLLAAHESVDDAIAAIKNLSPNHQS